MANFFCLTEDSPRAEQPKSIKIPLLKSQLTSLAACQKFERKRYFKRTVYDDTIKLDTNVAILADITGYGKSLIMLSLVATNDPPECASKTKIVDANCTGQLVIKKKWQEEYVPISVLVAPNKLIDQWITEAKKTGLKYSVVGNSGGDVDFSSQIIFCRSSRYNYFMNNIAEGLRFYRMIFDEADSISISKMADPRAEIIWLVTATPEAIPYVSNCGWIKNTFGKKNAFTNYYNHSIFELLSIRCDPIFTRSCSPIPPINKQIIRCVTPAHINLVKNYVPAGVLDKLNAGDLVGAIKDLGGGESTTANIIDIISARFDKRIAEKNQRKANIDTTQYTKADKETRIAQYNDDIKRLKADKAEFLKKLDNINKQNCPICYDNIDNLCMTPCCNGFFCHHCISDWFKTNHICPLCRSYVYVAKLILYNPAAKSKTGASTNVKNTPAVLSKEDTVVKLLKDHPKGKFLIFSDHDPTSKVLSDRIRSAGISFAELGGHAGTIKKALTMSEEGNTRALFMNARKNGAGLNMPWIDNVIIYHKLTDSVLTQVLGRTSRLGQKKRVNVWFLEYEHEYANTPNTNLFDDNNIDK